MFTHRLSLHLSFLKSLSFWASKANGPGLTTEPKERGTTSACLTFGCVPSICIPSNNNNPSMHFANPSISNPPLPRLQAMFAGSIPEIIDLIGIRRKYGGTFKVTKRSVCVPAVRYDY